ncbi:MAG: thymidylate synthase ThyX [Kiritimatiellae bacterium]|nr:thymidylate synthase ThyX [Kiritimatiellia bacterium]
MTTLKYLRACFRWRDVADAARTTIRMDEGTKEPGSAWKRRILLAEHSPIRQMIFKWKWHDLKYWISVHFVRHKFGIEHFVSTQRTDRTGVNREEAPQNAPVDHECFANAQAMIFISRKRLCRQASPETTEAWKLVLEEVKKIEPELYSVCVPECVYRGFCPEFKTCGYVNTEAFRKARAAYVGESEHAQSNRS